MGSRVDEDRYAKLPAGSCGEGGDWKESSVGNSKGGGDVDSWRVC